MITDKHTQKVLEYDKIVSMLVDFAVTCYGRSLCAELTPSSNTDDVVLWQKQTDDAVKLYFEKSNPPLSGFADIIKQIRRVKSKAVLSCGELSDIGKFLNAGKVLKSFNINTSERLSHNYIIQLIDSFIHLPELLESINKAIRSEEELNDDASENLSRIRRRIKESQSEVKSILEKIIKTHPDDLQEQLVTMRGNRYVVMLKAEKKSSIPGIIHDTSSSKATIFVEPYSVIEVNNRIREFMSEERDEIEKILKALTDKVYSYLDVFENNFSIIGNIDFNVAKGKMAVKMDAMPSEINDKGEIYLCDARHPLIPKDVVVPITIEIGSNYNTLVITGPNTGGKTVSLKTCGLLTLMTMSGLLIPAKETSKVSVFKNVFADIGDEQSIEQSLSTFSSHMTNLVKIAEMASHSTLVLADELGSGTDPASGAALATAILEYLRGKGCTTLATTHYKELKHYAVTTPGVENAGCEFDIETLKPTYRLFIGIPGASNAFIISQKLGLSEEIINMARAYMSSEEMNFESLIEETERARMHAKNLEQEAAKLLKQAKSQIDEANEMKLQLENKKDEIISTAKRKAKEYLEQEEYELEELLENVKNSIKEKDLEEVQKELNEIRKKIKLKTLSIDNDLYKPNSALLKIGIPEKFETGKEYYSSTLNISGILVEVSRNNKTCILFSGNKRINVPVSSLRIVNEKENIPKEKNTSSNRGKSMKRIKMESFSNEIKLLGMTVDDSLEKLDKFIDDAVITGIQSIRIVHGKGTGALRNAVSQKLRQDKRISSFRLGEFGEGDSGVTIATL